ncbi:Ribonuclease H [Planctomycetes bacterium LzC2]|uniref:Ribonuclease H n=2 Tax=Alienimonas chondri TaxID=2681879 RepID=A0ABX1VGK2_9PLAN|nr:Ribonuclease H [Alienimonas chondri]
MADAPVPAVTLFTDGACRGNPGPGGWAFILRHDSSGKEKEGSGGEALTTNNRMELGGVIAGLKSLNTRTRVDVVTDSTYVAKGSAEWMAGWKKNGWRRRVKGKGWGEVKNVDLWKELDDLLAEHDVTFKVVKGHSGHAENERCDELAVAAAKSFQK